MLIREILQGAESLLFPSACLTCRLPLESRREILCPACCASLQRSVAPWCQPCGRSLAGLGAGILRCADCGRNRFFFDQAISPCLYEGSAKELVKALKYQGRLSVAPFLGRLLAETVRERLGSDPADAVVPVPLHSTRLRERTFNQAQVLAQELGRRLDLPCWKHLLLRRSATPPQADLPREERLRNVAKAFAIRPDPFLRSARILLVDDVLTTGATANACAKLLKNAGAFSVTVVTAAQD
jgi:ComF family protein